MCRRLVFAAVGSAVYRTALLVATYAVCACSDAPCPAGWMEVNQRCVDQTMNASAVSGAPASPGGQTPATNNGSAGERAASAMPAETSSGAAAAPAMSGKPPTLADGERCASPDECSSGVCKNVRNGIGVCCGAMIDCCKTADDCPESYASAPQCDDASSCKGSKTVAVCMSGHCAASKIDDLEACVGTRGPDCGPYQDVTCMAAGSNQCRMSCQTNGECDANAFCANRTCQLKKPNGGACTNDVECLMGNCNNGVCCSANGECCKTAADCDMGLDAKCDKAPAACQGTARQALCENFLCRYEAARIDDDRACVAGPNTGRDCGEFTALVCTGMQDQRQTCKVVCDRDSDCDPGFQCMLNNGMRTCVSASAGIRLP